MQKQTEFYKTQLQKHVKAASQKLHFKLNFLVGPTIKNTVWCVTKHLTVFFAPQTQKLQVNKHNLNYTQKPFCITIQLYFKKILIFF
jgi:hypothetical protein